LTSPHFELLQRLFADILEVPPSSITPTSSPDTLAGWDSVRQMNLILGIEGELGLEFTEAEIESATDVPSILKLLDAKLG